MTKRVFASENVLIHTFGADSVVLNLDTEVYYTLNGTGIRMWQVLTTAASIDEAVQTLQQEYEVDEATLRQDVEEFIAKLKDLKMIKVDEAPTL